MIKVKYIGKSDTLSLLNGKIYDARILNKGWYGIVDETNEEYAYPPEHFKLISVYCPVKCDNINGADCYIICDVADGYIKPTLLPEGIEWNEKQRTECINCKWHDDVEE